MKDKRPLILIPVALAAAAAVYGLFGRREFLYAGTVEATEVTLSARLPSIIESVDAREGDQVKAGQRLARLACEDVKLAADIAGRDFARAERLYKEGSMSLETFERLRNRRDESQVQLGWCEVSSPVDGTVLARIREPKEFAPAGTKLVTVADLSRPYAYVFVPQTMLARLSLGQEVEGLLPELDMKAVKGRVEHIRSEAEFTPKNVQTREERTRLVFGVKVAFDNAERLLKPGMPIEVRLPRP